MYQPAKSVVLRLFRVSGEPPEAPAGAHASVHVARASPKYLAYRLLALGCFSAFLLSMALFAAIAALASGEPGVLAIPAAIALIGVPLVTIAYFCVRVDYELRYYVMTDRSVRVRHGAWVIDEKTLTYANVQNVRVVQGPLQRMFKISDVKIDVAGGGAAVEGKHGVQREHGVTIAGIENAAEVRDEILKHLRQRSRDSGLGDLDDAPREPARRGLTPAALAALREAAAEAAALRRAAR